MISAGNQIVAENDIQDPAPEIAAKLLKNMEQVHNMVPGKSPIQLSDNSIEKIAASSNGVPFILDVQTINWSFVYQPTDWTHYRVIYTAKARILDAKTKAVLAENICSNANTPVPDPLPTHDELLANKAALIKEKLALASKECAEQFKSTLLSL
jgi:hypothetical protein